MRGYVGQGILNLKGEAWTISKLGGHNYYKTVSLILNVNKLFYM